MINPFFSTGKDHHSDNVCIAILCHSSKSENHEYLTQMFSNPNLHTTGSGARIFYASEKFPRDSPKNENLIELCID